MKEYSHFDILGFLLKLSLKICAHERRENKKARRGNGLHGIYKSERQV